MAENDDRKPSVLTCKYRKFLRGDEGATSGSPSQTRQIRYRIRNRIRNALIDFTLIQNTLEPRDREGILRGVDSGTVEEFETEWLERGINSTDEGRQVLVGLQNTLTFIFTCIVEAGLPLDSILQQSLRLAHEERGNPFVATEVDLTVHKRIEDPNGLLEKFKNDEKLSPEERIALLYMYTKSLERRPVERRGTVDELLGERDIRQIIHDVQNGEALSDREELALLEAYRREEFEEVTEHHLLLALYHSFEDSFPEATESVTFEEVMKTIAGDPNGKYSSNNNS